MDDAQTLDSRFATDADKAAAQQRLADAVPRLTADQAEHALERLREAGHEDTTPTIDALLGRLEETGGVRRAGRARKWFGDTGRRDAARSERQSVGTLAQQRADYGVYVARLANELEAATRGHVVTPRMRSLHARGQGMSLETILTSNPDTIRANLSEEALQALAKMGRPLSFDAWRHAHRGASDSRAVASWQRRTSGFFSEHG